MSAGRCGQVRPTGDRRGNGAYALVTIPKGTCLGEYEGELLDEATYWDRYPSGVVGYLYADFRRALHPLVCNSSVASFILS